MRKKLVVLLALLITVVVLFAACGEDKPAEHVHDFGEWIEEVAATCEGAGTKGHYHCSGCNKDFDKDKNEITGLAIPATGHTEVADPAVAATCTEDGKTAGSHCSVCGTVIAAQTVVPATGHTPAAAVEENRVEATCTEAGSYDAVVYCSVCNAEISRTPEVIPAKGHTPAAAVEENRVEATCTEAGSYDAVVYCSVCSAEISRTAEVIPAKGHTDGEWIIDTATTCTEDGGKHKVCTVCGDTLDTEVIPATGHTYVWVEEEAATCGYDGVKGHYICSVCGVIFDEEKNEITEDNLVIPALGHANWTSLYVKKVDATCTEDGMEAHYHCTVCGKYFDAKKKAEVSAEDIVIPAKGHVPGKWVTVESTDCTQAGHKDQYCTRCNEIIATEELPAASHTPGPQIAKINPGCETEGRKEYYECTKCHKKLYYGTEVTDEELIIPPTGHNYGDWIEEVPGKAGTDGVMAHYHCNACGKDFDADYVEITDLTIHSYQLKGGYRSIIYDGATPTGVTPLEDAQLQEHYTCSYCGKTYDMNYNEIDPGSLQLETGIAIRNDTDMQALATMVNNGNTFAGETFKLVADVNLNTTLGVTSSNPFSGNFDGQGHTVTLNQTLSNPDGIGGLFSFIRTPAGGTVTIQNVHVTGTITATNSSDGKGYFGGVAGCVDGNTSGEGGTINFSNVWNSVCINLKPNNRWSSVGGFIGFTRHADGLKSLTVNFEGCVWDGVINAGPAMYYMGGYVGYTGNNKAGRTLTINISDSISAGTFQSNIDWNQFFGMFIGYAKGSFNDDPTAKVTINISNSLSLNKATYSKNTGSGSLIGLVSQIDGTTELNISNVYYKEVARNGVSGDMPIIAEGSGTVSNVTRLDNNVAFLKLTAENFSDADSWLIAGGLNLPCPKSFNEVFGQPDFLKVEEYDIYDEFEIGTPEALLALRDSVESGKNYFGKTIILTADLDMTGLEFDGLGTSTTPFSGNIDGQGHTVILDQSYSGALPSRGGLIRFLAFPTGGTITIENVRVAGKIAIAPSSNDNSNDHGALITDTKSAPTGSGECILNITNCISSTWIEVSKARGQCIGGFIGWVGHQDGFLAPMTINMESCLWDGTINAGYAISDTGGFIGSTGLNKNNRTMTINIKNSVAAGKIMLNVAWSDNTGLIIGLIKSNYQTGITTVNVENMICTARFTSSVTLNSGNWYAYFTKQNTNYGVLNLTNFYYVEFNCGGFNPIPLTPSSGGAPASKTNVVAKTVLDYVAMTEADFTEAEKWTFAGGVNYPCPTGIYETFGQPEVLKASEYDVKSEFEIGTAEELLALRDAVNGGKSYAGKTVKLTADIDLDIEGCNGENEWIEIGRGTAFAGTFDGQGHTINFVSNQKWTSGYMDGRTGLFGTLNGATVKNLNLTGSMFLHNNSTEKGTTDYIGSVAGKVQGTVLIQNVTSSVDITTKCSKNPEVDNWPGGIANVAGLVGAIPHNVDANITIDGCTYSGTINVANQAVCYAGIMANTGNGGNKTVTIQNCAFTGKMMLNENSGYAMEGIAGIFARAGSGTVTITNTYSAGQIFFNRTKAWPTMHNENPVKMGQIVGYNENNAVVNIDSTVTYKPASLYTEVEDGNPVPESKFTLAEMGQYNGVYNVDTDAVVANS